MSVVLLEILGFYGYLSLAESVLAEPDTVFAVILTVQLLDDFVLIQIISVSIYRKNPGKGIRSCLLTC